MMFFNVFYYKISNGDKNSVLIRNYGLESKKSKPKKSG